MEEKTNVELVEKDQVVRRVCVRGGNPQMRERNRSKRKEEDKIGEKIKRQKQHKYKKRCVVGEDLGNGEEAGK